MENEDQKHIHLQQRFSELLALKEQIVVENLLLVKEERNGNGNISGGNVYKGRYDTSSSSKDALQYTLQEHEDWANKKKKLSELDPLEKELKRLTGKDIKSTNLETFSSNLRKRTDPAIRQERAAAARLKKEKFDTAADVTSINERNRNFNKKLERE